MKKSIVYSWTACVITLMFLLAQCKQVAYEKNDQQKVQAAVDRIRKNLSDSLGISYPSINVLVQTPTETIFVSSSNGSGSPITADSYYRYASNTKNFTSASILNMYEDGWLDYKAKIADLIPGSKIPYVPATAAWNFPYKNEITIEQLLQHSAGVYDIDNDSVSGYTASSYTETVQLAEPTHQFTTDEMVNILTQKNLSYFKPGTDYHYSNTGYSILSAIISRVYSYKTGKEKSYSDYVQDFIVGDHAPVPLKTIHFPVLAGNVTLPAPYVPGNVLSTAGTLTYSSYNMTAQIGEGNGYGTMSDLNTYIRTMMTGKNALTPASIQLMQKDVSLKNPEYALGCTFRKNLGYGHNGARIGYLSQMAYDPDTQVSIVSMINLWDIREGSKSFLKCYNAMYDAAFAARQVLGYPGKP